MTHAMRLRFPTLNS
ncbi:MULTISPECIES: erythromycin resistance leader peptide [Bacillaceae]